MIVRMNGENQRPHYLQLLIVSVATFIFFVRGALGYLAAGLTVLAVVSVQYRKQRFFISHETWRDLLQNKFAFIVFLRQQIPELLLLFFMYLYATILLWQSERSPLRNLNLPGRLGPLPDSGGPY
jgi:hypothetical protein